MPPFPEIHAYLAGPDVFYPDAIERGAKKKAFLADLGIKGHFPFDNEITSSSQDKTGFARKIADANESMMLDCCLPGRFALIIADMTPFRGPSTDVGTAFEIGFMAALSHRAGVLIAGYTSDLRPFEERVRADFYNGVVQQRDDGVYGADGMRLESFGELDNLMLTSAIARTGGCIRPSFQEAAREAKRLIDHRIASITAELG